MATSAAIELRELDAEELATRLKDAKEQLFTLRFQQATGQLDNVSSLKHVKRDIARIHTVLQERALGIDTSENSAATGKDR